MGKHKIVKSAAAVALVASAVTAVAPGASAASYKVNAKDQLVSSSTGKLVKGWKVFGGKLYKNGKLAPAKKYKIIGKGAAQRLYYGPTLKKGYKTANSKALLFKDGKLADGWKQAGKNERLYKNGKLDKGYTVYTNVEGDKFLYLNGKLKKGDKTATRAGETLLFTDGLLSKGLKEFKGKTYYNGKVANGTIDGKEYDNGVLVTDIASVKAINNTTVEVTFKTSKADVKAADFTIEGLEVKNAAVKQTDSKVVVLTTAPQEANKEYTVKYGDSTKTFTGVSAVIPTAVTLSNGSQQAILGNQVTVEATVAVAEGQSKAGIPVTFNITNVGAVEAFTDENGVAKYTYTKYTTQDDEVVAYATGDASKRSIVGKVYWGSEARLAISEVTSGNTVANQGKKVYKIKTTDAATIKAGYVFVAFKENVDVTPDKLVKGVSVVDTTVLSNGQYPYQVTTGGVQYVAVKLDAKGEANFTLQGTEATVTPIVFSDAQFIADYNNNQTVEVAKGEGSLDKTELQAEAPAVTFAKNFSNQLEVTANGVQKAAAKSATITTTPGQTTDLSTTKDIGGRTYTVVVKDKDGKLAPAGTKAYVTFKEGDFSTDKDVYVQGSGDTIKLALNATQKQTNRVEITVTGNEGKATFKVAGAKDAFAKPTVYFDNGAGTAANSGWLEDADLQVTGETTYFVDQVVANAKLTSSAAPSNKVTATTPVTFTYSSLDQNNNVYAAGANEYEAAFEVSATNADVNVYKTDDTLLGTVAAGSTKVFKQTTGDKATVGIKVLPVGGKAADVTVTASATNASLPVKTASVSFTKVVTAVENAVAKINAAQGYANDKDLYNTVVGENIVTADNLAAVKTAVGVAYTNKGKDLTAEEIASTVKEAVKAKAKADAAAALAKVDAGNAAKADYELLADQEVAAELVPVLNRFFSTPVFAQTGTAGAYVDVNAPAEAEATVANVKSVVTAIKAATPENSTRDSGNDVTDNNGTKTYKAHKFSVDINTTNILALLTADGNVVTVTDDSANIIHLGTNKVYTFYALKADKTWIKVTADNTAQ